MNRTQQGCGRFLSDGLFSSLHNLYFSQRLALLSALCGLFTLAIPAVVIAAPVDEEKLTATVTEALRPAFEQYRAPGVALALILDGEPYFFTFGETALGEGEPVTERTLFEIGSVSKTFTATLAAYAEVKGALDFAKPVSTYIPPLRDSAMDSVSVLNLATHTAGHFPLQVPERVRNDGQLLAYFRNWTPGYVPGSKRTYANPASGLLGLVAARSLNQPFAQAMEQYVFRGLGLSETFLQVPAENMAQYAEGHNSQHQPVRLHMGLLGEEAYGVRSSAADLARYLAAQMQLVKVNADLEKALQKTRTGYFQTDYYVQDLVWEQYTLPVDKSRLLSGNARAMIAGDQPVTAIEPPLAPQQGVLLNKTGSTGGFSTYVAFIPQRKFGFVLLANKYFPNEVRIEALYHLLATLQPEVVKAVDRYDRQTPTAG